MDEGWIIKTRQGGLHKCSLYGVTWLPINDCKGKLEVASTKGATHDWKDINKKTLVRRAYHSGTATGPIEEGGYVN
jgi:hypothetical protein